MLIIDDDKVEEAILRLLGDDSPNVYTLDTEEGEDIAFDDFHNISLEDRLGLLTALGVERLVKEMLLSLREDKHSSPQLVLPRVHIEGLSREKASIETALRAYVGSISTTRNNPEERAVLERWMKETLERGFEMAEDLIKGMDDG